MKYRLIFSHAEYIVHREKTSRQKLLNCGKYKSMVKRLTIFIILLVFLFNCKGKEEQNASSASPGKDTLEINIGSEPPTLDWSLATDSTSYTIILNLMDGLTRFGKNMRPEPDLAEGWEISKD